MPGAERVADLVMLSVGAAILVWCIAAISRMTYRTQMRRRLAFVVMSAGAFVMTISAWTGLHHEFASIGIGAGTLMLLWSGLRGAKVQREDDGGDDASAA